MKSYLDVEYLKKISDMSSKAALKKARMYGTKLSVYEDGKVKHESPDEYEKNLLMDLEADGLVPSKN